MSLAHLEGCLWVTLGKQPQLQGPQLSQLQDGDADAAFAGFIQVAFFVLGLFLVSPLLSFAHPYLSSTQPGSSAENSSRHPGAHPDVSHVPSTSFSPPHDNPGMLCYLHFPSKTFRPIEFH